MKKYVKPEVVETKDYANAGSDTCQECSKSGGQRNTPLPGEESAREADFTGCIDGRPVKRS